MADALCEAVEHQHLDCIEYMHEFGISLNAQRVCFFSSLLLWVVAKICHCSYEFIHYVA